MDDEQIIEWLLQGDVSIQFQVYRDLLDKKRIDLQKRIASEGWGKAFLSKRNANGHWGDRFYQPKWISTHYTLLDLRNFGLAANNKVAGEAIKQVLKESKAEDGGLRLGPSTSARSDVCVNGMFLNYASYFQTPQKDLKPIIDCLLNEKMSDGGFNCRSTRSGCRHSSLHSTISVLEGLDEYLSNKYSYRSKDVQSAIKQAEEFVLIHQLFISYRTGKIIHKDFLKLPYPSRWKFDILRGLDYFQKSGRAWDSYGKSWNTK